MGGAQQFNQMGGAAMNAMGVGAGGGMAMGAMGGVGGGMNQIQQNPAAPQLNRSWSSPQQGGIAAPMGGGGGQMWGGTPRF